MKRLAVSLTILASLCAGASVLADDAIYFGNAQSEAAHRLHAPGTEVVNGGLGERARRILPPREPGYRSGPIAFDLAVDPAKRNHLTVKFWGSDVTSNRLVVFLDGKQFGYLHLGDYELLDTGAKEARFPDRFHYVTQLIPESATKGRDRIRVEIYAHGPFWGYGANFAQFQKNMTEPSRGIYAAYAHVDPYFEIPSSEKKADPIAVQPPAENDPAAVERSRAQADSHIRSVLDPKRKTLNQMQILTAAKARAMRWNEAATSKETLDRIVSSLDALYRQWRKAPRSVVNDGSTWNPGWFGLGPAGEAILLLASEIEPRLGETIEDHRKNPVVRRDAWADMFRYVAREQARHRRMYTNQTMIIDLNLHWTNRSLAFLDPEKAFPLEMTLGFLKESVGLRPWSGSLDRNGAPTWPQGRNYMQLTDKGLTKELGYVGIYGEVMDWVDAIYNATRPSPDRPGDPEIRDALVRIMRARSFFRYPEVDASHRRVMRLETVVGWRDTSHPGDVVYAIRPGRDMSPIRAAVDAADPVALGGVAQMEADGRLSASLDSRLKENTLRVALGSLSIPKEMEEYRAMLAANPDARSARLPMTPGQPDFVFADEENGVLAVKNGDEILYASLYWRARHGVNSLARIHYLTPSVERVATVHEDVAFENSGKFWTRPGWTIFGFGNGGTHIHYPDSPRSLHEGDVVPIARFPGVESFKPGQEHPLAGRCDFYRLSYGPFEIGMNASKDKTFRMRLPEGRWKLLPDGESVSGGSEIEIAPRSTLVWRRIPEESVAPDAPEKDAEQGAEPVSGKDVEQSAEPTCEKDAESEGRSFWQRLFDIF